MGVSPERLTQRAAELQEYNPMLGFRGCRLAIAFPEIAEMQARAIFEGAIMARRKTGVAVRPEIMTPLIIAKAEFDLIKARVDEVAQAVAAETDETIAYSCRHDDRDAAGLSAGRRTRPDRRVLFIWHQ